jgi:hypothetical protein
MNRSKGADIDRLSYRPKGGFFEPKRDSFGRASFRMPGVCSLAALSMAAEDEHWKIFRLTPGHERDAPRDKVMIT